MADGDIDCSSADGSSKKRELEAALVDIRGRIRGHAGDVAVDKWEDGVVTLEFLGACRGCPAQAFTFYAVVEPALASVEGVTRVEPPRSACAPSVAKRIRKMLQQPVARKSRPAV